MFARVTGDKRRYSRPIARNFCRRDCLSATAGAKDAYVEFIENVPFYGAAVLCLDHPEVQALIPRIRDRRIVTYGFAAQADVRGVEVTAGRDGNRFDCVVRDRDGQTRPRRSGLAPVRRWRGSRGDRARRAAGRGGQAGCQRRAHARHSRQPSERPSRSPRAHRRCWSTAGIGRSRGSSCTRRPPRRCPQRARR